MRWRARYCGLSFVTFVLACDKPPNEHAPTSAPLTSGVVARVSGDGAPPISIGGDVVVDIARAQRVPLVEARDRAISDALFAFEAIRQKKDVAHPLDLDSVLVRRLTEEFRAQARSQGPVKDDEVEVITQKRWWDVARPEGFMTVTAVVKVAPNADPATEKRAEALAEAIRDAVLAIPATAKATEALPMPTNPRIPEDPLTPAFRAAALSVKKDGLEVELQQVQPLGKDGLGVVPSPFPERQAFEPSYVKATLALVERGDVAPVTRSGHGFHVIMLLARYPGVEVSLEERRHRFEGEVYDLRAQKIVDELVARLHQEVDVELERNTDGLLAEVHPSDRVMNIVAEIPHAPSPPHDKTSPGPSPP